MPRIIVQFGGEEWAVDLHEGVNVAGRSPQASIPIRDASMSREHCEIVLEGGVATVVDRGSMNGTLVNGTRMDRKVLEPGDKIQIGKASIFFEEKRGAAAAPAGKKQAEPVVGIDDFSVWRRESGGMMKVVLGLVVLVVLAVGAVFLFRSIGSGSTVAVDPGNLIVTGRFEPGPDRTVMGWAVKPGLASRIHAAEGSAKEGKTCLQLDKSGGVNDLVAEVVNQDVLPVSSAAALEVSAWVRSESSSVLPALKASWLSARTGPVLIEEASEPAPGSSDWTQLAHSFAPPPGATHVQLSLIAVGRAGRVLFDDVRAKFGSSSGNFKTATLSGYSVTATPAGVLGVSDADGRRIMNNLQLLLSSDKEGTIHQLVATGGRVQVDEAARKITVAGKLASPVDLRPIEFEIEARAGKESLLLGYQLRGDALKQLDRIGLSLLLPGLEPNPKGDYTNPVPRLWFRSGSGDFLLETDGLMRVTGDWVPQARRANLLFLPKGVTELAFSFVLKPGAGGQMDPMTAANKSIEQGRMQDAVDMFNDILAATREEQKREDIKSRLRQLEETEAADWQAVQAQRFMADLVGLKPYFEAAIQKLDEYDKRWPSGKRAEASKAERAKLTAGLAKAAEDRDTLRATRLLDRAEEHLKEGRKVLARELCETVRRHYGQTTAAARATEMMKKLGSE
jgi:hypothetical protein